MTVRTLEPFLPPRRLLASPEVRAGTTLYANFANPTQVASLFDITGFSYGTDTGDSSRPVLAWTTTNTEASIIAKGIAWRNFEVFARFRVHTSPGGSTRYDLVGRRTDANNQELASKDFAADQVRVRQVIDGSASDVATFSQATETAGIWCARFRVVNDLFWAKYWIASAVEPDWQVVTTRATGAAPNDVGVAGFVGVATGTATQSNLSEMSVTELVPASDNLIENGDFSIDDGTNMLRWGTPLVRDLGTALTEFVDDPDGIYGRVAHCSRTANDANGAGVEQLFYRRGGTGLGRSGANYDLTYARYLEVEIVSRADNVHHLSEGGGNFLGAAWVIYWYDQSGSVTNVSEANAHGQPYYGGLGPRGIVGGNNGAVRGSGGEGSWGWHLTPHRVKMSQFGALTGPIDRGTLGVVFHDQDTVGDLWIASVRVRPVS